jgi:hypothetical protein
MVHKTGEILLSEDCLGRILFRKKDDTYAVVQEYRFGEKPDKVIVLNITEVSKLIKFVLENDNVNLKE